MKESWRKQGGSAASPCAACKLLRRRCAKDCVFAPYFPADEPHKFASVHKVFGASNVNKLLQCMHACVNNIT
nr:LOB domain-containing protein 4-like [Ipomoea batatas]